jgi:hypothetical protein
MDEEWKRYLQMAASGGLTGASMGGLGKILGGSRSLPAILGGVGLGAATGATAIPAAAYVGEQVLGAPSEDEQQPYTLRAGLGGTIAGAGVGALGGGYIGSGLAEAMGRTFPGAAAAAHSQLPLDNLIIDKLKKAGKWKGALAGAGLGALALGFTSADEGQQIDTFRNLARSARSELSN